MKKQTFDNNIYMKIINWIYQLLVANLGLLIVNFPFVCCSLFLALDIRNVFAFSLSMLLFGPAFYTLIAYLNQLREYKDIDRPFYTFIDLYKKWFVKGISNWLIPWIIINLLAVDAIFFYHFELLPIALPVLVIIGLGIIGYFLNFCYFNIRNEDKTHREIRLISIYYLLKKWYVVCVNFILIICYLVVQLIKPQFGLLITPVVFVGLIYLNQSKLHQVK